MSPPIRGCLLGLWVACCLGAAVAARAEEPAAGDAPSKPVMTQPEKPTGPMTINSDRLIMHQEDHRAHFEGHVVFRQGDLALTADLADVWLSDTATNLETANSGNSVSAINAKGHVDMVYGDRHAKADEAHYDQATQLIVLTGHVEGDEAGYHVDGPKMTIYLQEQRSVVEGGSHVVIPPGATSPSATSTPAAGR